MIGIYQEVNFSYFVDGFYRVNRGEQFSHEALAKLFDFYNELSSDLGEPIKFDPIAICCEWVETSKEEIIEDYDLCEVDDPIKYLEDNTQYYILDNGNILFQQF